MTDPEARDPEDTVTDRPEDIADTAVDVVDEFERPLSIETPEADAVEQKLAVEGEDDDYPME